ncbi:MAG: serine/threonine protein kinase [Deltaproteobacteria bacterium]|nr:serine/threonine protein kinase [Deltaproteobacteria bacterium]
MLEPGDSLEGKYRIIGLLGEGGMGAVFEAENTLVKRRVAVKLLKPEYSQNVEAVKRFTREAQAAGQIGHENICEVTDIGYTASGPPYLVMQLLRGKPLTEAMASVSPFPIPRAIDILSQVLEALEAAHAAGIVHRDMKPDNIFLTRVAGRPDFVKLLDFGISKVRNVSNDAEMAITRTGTVLGTPLYMSPEQARGDTDVDGRADVWAVGVILYEMICGRNPFAGENYNRTMYNVLSAPVPSVRRCRDTISAELEDAVKRAMARDAGLRFQTAAEMRRALLATPEGATVGDAVRRRSPSSVPPPFDGETAKAPVHVGDDALPTVPRLLPAGAEGRPAGLRIAPRVLGDTATPGAGAVPGATRVRAPRRSTRWIIGGVAAAVAIAGVVLLVLRGTRPEPPTTGGPPPAPPVAATAPAAPPPMHGAVPPTAGPTAPPEARGAGEVQHPSESLDVVPDAIEGPPAAVPDADPTGTGTVRITLVDVPSGAKVTADGEPRAGPAFEVPRSGRGIRVVVEADGYEPWAQIVSPAAPLTVPVQLVPLPAETVPQDALGGSAADRGAAARDAAGRGPATAGRDASTARDGRSAVDGAVSSWGVVP